jgi:hypothetical protein
LTAAFGSVARFRAADDPARFGWRLIVALLLAIAPARFC